MTPLKKQFQQHATLSISALLAIILLITLNTAIQQWRDDWRLAHPTVTPTPSLALKDNTTLITTIVDEHLFGQAVTKIGEIPLTNLPLRVTSIIHIETKEHDAASKTSISISGKPSNRYQAGDSLPYGIKIHSILADAVILENAGRIEKLPLGREKLQFKPRVPKENE